MLVSCLTVTTDRLRLLKQAIACYCAQTYSPCELVVLAAGTPRYQAAIEDHVRILGRDDIRVVRVHEPAPSLGRLRNLSVQHARGELICQWDDDDLYHPDRVRVQLAALEQAGVEACFLSEHLHLYPRDRTLYWIDWARDAGLAREQQMVPSSVLARRSPALVYPETGAESRLGEDNVVRAAVWARGAVALPPGHGYLYIYRFHGRNVTSSEHHQRIRAWGALEHEAILRHRPALDRALAAFALPLPCAIKARGGATAYTWDARP
jgi:glycosyltransferase involved in cell wall biosynthesis